jgi:hypothetical protein
VTQSTEELRPSRGSRYTIFYTSLTLLSKRFHQQHAPTHLFLSGTDSMQSHVALRKLTGKLRDLLALAFDVLTTEYTVMQLGYERIHSVSGLGYGTNTDDNQDRRKPD